VFVADRTSYTGSDDPLFLGDVGDAIMAYYGLPEYLAGQDRFNFWVSRTTGSVEDADQGCDHEADGVSFADAHAILHRVTGLRDCAPGGRRVFSAEVDGQFPRVVRHETAHRPFGLADEYCDLRNPPAGSVCDGGYFEASPHPNLYESRDACEVDAPSLLDASGFPRTAADCQSFEEVVNNWFDATWWVSEPVNDLMVNNTVANAADDRRIQWLLDRCRDGDC
jgi:hypothetical protein